jgi:hypothetical protein
MRRLTTFTFAAALAVGTIGCETATNTTVNKSAMNGNTSNVAVVVNNNSNMAANTGMNTNKMVMNSNVSRADYDRDRAKYEAEKGASTIGQGANDSWIWFKTKGALATTDDLRDSTINVDVANDVVTLRGTVATKAESDKAASVAKGIEGVKSVTNNLKVQAGDSMTNQMVGGNSNTTSNANMKK